MSASHHDTLLPVIQHAEGNSYNRDEGRNRETDDRVPVGHTNVEERTADILAPADAVRMRRRGVA